MIRFILTAVIQLGLLFSCVNFTNCLHLTGTWRTSDFYIFLSRFGFQKTDPGMLDSTQGFIYGNITTVSALVDKYTLVLVDSDYFMEFYGNHTRKNSLGCQKMFKKIDNLAYDEKCTPDGTEDFLRKIPCRRAGICVDEDVPQAVLSGYQFTYRVQNSIQPRFWYLSMVTCQRDGKQCTWERSSDDVEIEYDIWLVNGDPASKHLNPFEHQFSFEMHDIVEMFAIFTVMYSIVLPVWIHYGYRPQVHKITTLLTVCISMELTGIVFNLLHVFIFAFNGVGAEWLKVIGNLLGTFSECLFMLLLLLIAKGWTIISLRITSKPVVFGFWGVYTALNALFFIIGLTKIDFISNIDEWNMWPGYLIIGFRLLVMFWFVAELRATARRFDPDRVDFIVQFGAYFLVWFIYLPVLVLVATQISHLWRTKTILSITYAADLLSYCILIHLLWPSRSVLYLIKGDVPLPQYDLEAAGLFDPDDMEVTEFRSYKPLKHAEGSSMETSLNGMRTSQIDAGSKTNLLESDSSVTSPKKNGIINNGHAYTNISLADDEEEEQEL